jgi:hypothetical protein
MQGLAGHTIHSIKMAFLGNSIIHQQTLSGSGDPSGNALSGSQTPPEDCITMRSDCLTANEFSGARINEPD